MKPEIHRSVLLTSLLVLIAVGLVLLTSDVTADPIFPKDPQGQPIKIIPLIWPYSGGTKYITYRSTANPTLYGTAIQNATNTWNGFGANIRLRETGSGEQVLIVNEFHPEDWPGTTIIGSIVDLREGTYYIRDMKVVINDAVLSWSVLNDKENTMCHEFGHVFGLDHDWQFNDEDCTFYTTRYPLFKPNCPWSSQQAGS